MQDSLSGKRLGVGVIGLGMVARLHGKALQDLEPVLKVEGIYSPSLQRRETFSAEFGFPLASSIDALIEDEAVDAVIVLTPPNARLEIVQKCVRAGKHILLEKPIERTSAAAEEIVALCEAAGLRLGVVLHYRHRQSSIQLKRLVEQGTLGKLGAVHVVVPWWRPQSYYDEPGRGTYSRDGGGVLIVQAIHSLDLMLSLTGAVKEVQAVTGRTSLHTMEAEDFVSAGLRFVSGAFGSVTATTASFPGFAEHMTLNFERASARLDGGLLTIFWHDGTVEKLGAELGSGGGADPMAFTHEWHRSVIADFVSAVRADRAPLVSGRDALGVHRLIDAIIESSREGNTVAVQA